MRMLPTFLTMAALLSSATHAQHPKRPTLLQPAIDRSLSPVLNIDGFEFRDLNRNGRLDPYEDWRLSQATRIEDLIARMTLREKAGTMMHGTLIAPDSVIGISSMGYDLEYASSAIKHHDISSFITRLTVFPRKMAEQNNAVQAIAAQSRLGIPVTISTDPRHHFQQMAGASAAANGYSRWPESLGFAALRQPSIVREFGDIARQEYRATGIHMALSPQADLFTEPRWPRGTATFGADPHSARNLVAAYVTGFQGGVKLARNGVATVVKHWVGYGAGANGFDGHSYYGRKASLSDQTLRLHASAFRGAFDVGVAGLMPTYDIITGPTIHGAPSMSVGAGFNKPLLDLARKTYGFRGMILSDWAITSDCSAECRSPTKPQTPKEIGMPWGMEEASRVDRYVRGVNAGIDQFGGETDSSALVEGVQRRKISVRRIDEAVGAILAVKFQLGLFEQPIVDPSATQGINSLSLQARTREVQAQAQILLKNDQNILPLRAGTRVYLDGLDGDAARASGLVVVARIEDADAAIVRAETPYEILHPLYFFGSHQHEGRLDFRKDDQIVRTIGSLSRRVPVILSLFLDRPAVLGEVTPFTSAILANFGADDNAVMDALTGKYKVSGKLPFELPSSASSVDAQRPDMPDDSLNPAYPSGFGLELPARQLRN